MHHPPTSPASSKPFLSRPRLINSQGSFGRLRSDGLRETISQNSALTFACGSYLLIHAFYFGTAGRDSWRVLAQQNSRHWRRDAGRISLGQGHPHFARKRFHVPIVDVQRRAAYLGGAANVATATSPAPRRANLHRRRIIGAGQSRASNWSSFSRTMASRPAASAPPRSAPRHTRPASARSRSSSTTTSKLRTSSRSSASTTNRARRSIPRARSGSSTACAGRLPRMMPSSLRTTPRASSTRNWSRWSSRKRKPTRKSSQLIRTPTTPLTGPARPC